MRRPTPYRVVVAALVVLLAVVVVGNSPGTTVTDIKPEVYLAPGEMIGRYLSAWTGSPYLGFPNFNVGLAPVVAVLAPGAAIGLSAEWLFKLFHLALWLVAALGAHRALRCLVPGASAWAGLVAAVAYVANPYAVVGGSTLAILLPYAFLPWLVVALVRALSDPDSWRWPAGFGLAFFAMSGMNVAVVPIFQLVLVPPVALVVGRAVGLSWGVIVKVLAKCGAFLVGVSLYWLLPAIAAAATGIQVASESEDIRGIAGVSSLVEVLRGMGMWSLYGSGPAGPWVPEFEAYLANPLVVVSTLAWPVVALVALLSAPPVLRRVAASTIGLVAVVLVGFFPGAVTTPLAGVVQWLFESVPALVAFRTTNKVGAVLALVFAFLLGQAVPRWLAMLGRSRLKVASAAVLVVGLVAVWVLPAVTGTLYTSPVDVPGYWRDAAAAVDAQSHDSRVLFLPNQIRASYRWTDERPDDVANALMTREAIIPESSPNASPPGANYLAALGDLVASAAAGPDTVSTMARYLGAGDILLRHDTRWEDAGGVRPAVSASMLATDPGLLGLANFGDPGQNLGGAGGAEGAESILPPVQHYGVKEAMPTVSARTLEDSVTVAGDAWSFDALARSGSLAAAPVVTYASDLTSEQFAAVLGPEHRLVLTDTNRRQSAIPNRLVAGYGPLLPEGESPDPTRALGTADAQTVLRRTGPTLSASQVGSAFFDTPYGQVDNVADGDPTTSWLFGDFDRAPGATLDVTWPTPLSLGSISIRPTALGRAHLDQVTLSAGGVSRSVTLPDSGVAQVDLGGVTSDRLTLRVDSVRGDGAALVGIAELGLPGSDVVRVARAPLSFDDLYGGLDQAGLRAFSTTPFDVSFTRVANGEGTFDDSERSMLRDFTLPGARTFTASATATEFDRSPAALDELAGRTGDTVATSSSLYFDNPDVRASMASDEDPGTAWIPGGDPIGAWWQIQGPMRSVPSVLIEQRPTSAASPSQTAMRVAVEVDGERVAEVDAGPGRTEVPLPPTTRGRTVRLVILNVEGPPTGLPPQFVTIDTGVSTPSAEQPTCVTVALLDGRPLRMRPASPDGLGRAKQVVQWRGCSTVGLRPGAHSLRPVEGFVLDSLDLADARAPIPQPKALNFVTATSGRDVSRTIEVAATAEPVALKIGQSFDPRWRASVDGDDLGPPCVVDGWSTGWVLDPGEERTVLVRFAPQRPANVALVASGVSVLAAMGLFLFGRSSTGRRLHRVPVEPAPPGRQRPSWVRDVVAGLGAAVGFGVPGLVGAGLVAGLDRLPRWRPEATAPLGIALVALGGLIQVVGSSASWGTVDAAVPSSSLWPHWVAVVGLVLTLVSVLREPRHREPDPRGDPT